MKKFQWIMLLAIAIVACKSGANKSATEDKSGSTITTSKHKYGIKSGIITQEIETMGMKMKPVIYFDDYGAKESTETIMEMMGFKTDNLTIHKDGYIYTIDLQKKTGTKHKDITSTSANINFKTMSEEMKKKMSLQELGTEQYLGKKCTKYAIDYKDMNMKGTYLIYENIPMQMDATIGTMATKLKVIKMEENITIPADKFEVPVNIPITDSDATRTQPQ